MWNLNSMLLNNPLVKEEVKRENKKYSETNENGNRTHPNLWDAAKAILREVYSYEHLREETRKISNKQRNFTDKIK